MRIMLGNNKTGVVSYSTNIRGNIGIPTNAFDARDYNIMLVTQGSAKLTTVKTVKNYLGIGLKEAKELVDSVTADHPAVLKEFIGVTSEYAEEQFNIAQTFFTQNNCDAELQLVLVN